MVGQLYYVYYGYESYDVLSYVARYWQHMQVQFIANFYKSPCNGSYIIFMYSSILISIVWV